MPKPLGEYNELDCLRSIAAFLSPNIPNFEDLNELDCLRIWVAYLRTR